MKKNIILLFTLIALYFGIGISLKAVYGDSYPFMQGDHYWEPDGTGAWVAHGNPTTEMPTEPSELPPLITYYLPFFVPGFMLFLFLFTPLGKLLEEKKVEAEKQESFNKSEKSSKSHEQQIEPYTTQSFIEYFYSKFLFGEIVYWENYCDSVFHQLESIDENFRSVNRQVFEKNLRALWLEIVGIIWFIRYDKKLALRQTIITYAYLNRNKLEEYWKLNEPYNKAIAESTIGSNDRDSALDRGKVTYINQVRFNAFNEWTKQVEDPTIAARTANRLFSKKAWKSKKTQFFLSLSFFTQLNIEPSEKMLTTFLIIIYGLSNGLEEELEKFDITI